LNKLNGNNKIVDNQVEIIGVETLYGANLKAKDLRGCVSLVFAGLCANGVTVVDGYEYLERGYHNFLEKITKIGGNITIREMK
jgi:UDP-N-acetylglucosamine 1-carboxyvinyltransferase